MLGTSDMSPDEVVVAVASAFIGPVLWAGRLFSLSRVETFRARWPVRRLAALVAALSAAIYLVLRLAAADDVRNAPEYLVMYVLVGIAWLKLAESGAALFGLSARTNLVEHGNAAAWPALAGLLTGVAACYAGGNIGDGPGWWVVIFAAGLASLGLASTWVLVEATTRITESVTVDRDVASGVRLGGFLAACGLVLGRSVAGDWVSAAATVVDAAVVAWPVALGLALAVLVEGRLSPSVDRPVSSVFHAGVIPALGYVLVAVVYVWGLGWPV
jgi:hypothetical protein